ncbi:MAG: arsenate reductase ArsC [Methanomicrobiales archaeon]|nr:arsenate reductase ArsC [Methanomicrobiales archaeon]
MPRKKRVLFICGSNAARSQMAEGYLRARYGDAYEAFSAGLKSSTVSRDAIDVMAELGIDISRQYSKDLRTFEGMPMDLVVTLCESEGRTCPVFPWGAETVHVPLPDPFRFQGTRKERLAGFRRVRDAIIEWIDRNLGDHGA